MLLPPYVQTELGFAYQLHVFFRWHTYRTRPVNELRLVTAEWLENRFPEIRISELHSSSSEMAVLVRLRPTESVATAASKLKGSTSRFIREQLALIHQFPIWATGYFAATFGSPTCEEVNQYLARQAEHHGYDQLREPPVWYQSWPDDDTQEDYLKSHNAVTRISWHIVLSVARRQVIFDATSGEEISRHWCDRARLWKVRFRRVSFLPDHVHLAVRAHPSLMPAEFVLHLLNETQELMLSQFPGVMRGLESDRLWVPGAYLGSIGSLSGGHVVNYLRRTKASGFA